MHTLHHFPYAQGDVLENMARDAVLFDLCQENDSVTLRFYGWRSPALTFGYSQRFDALPTTRSQELPIVRRLTGGGVVYHGPDLTYALALPKKCLWASIPARETYRILHGTLLSILQARGAQGRLAPCPQCATANSDSSICFASPQLHDVVALDGRKIAGAAMRRSNRALLIQGSLYLPPAIDPTGFREDFTERLKAALCLDGVGVPAFCEDRLRQWMAHFADPEWNRRH